MPNPVITVHDLGKRYHLNASATHNTLRDHIAHGVKAVFSVFQGRPEKNAAPPEPSMMTV